MNILYVGVQRGTSAHRLQALRRLGHNVHIVNPDEGEPRNPVLRKLQHECGSLPFERRVTAYVLKAIEKFQFDFTLVDSGRLVGPGLVEHLRKYGPVVNYNVDDPLGTRDRLAWLLYRRTVSSYDMIVVVRQENVAEGYNAGAKRVLLQFRSADEVAHAPRPLTAEDHARWDSDVVFVGTWFPERGPFMAELVKHGVPLAIYGNRWQMAKEWPLLQKAWKGPGTTNDDDYAKAIQCSKICLGLLSKGNRDLHTQRSLEVPALGGLFCAERTSEHEQLYRDGEEAIFWRDADECAVLCKRFLADDERRRETARRGRERNLVNGYFNEKCLARIISEALCP
jgi:spore maturation protein CgeB